MAQQMPRRDPVVPTAGFAGTVRRSLRTYLSLIGRDARLTGTSNPSVFTVKLGGCRAVVAIDDGDRAIRGSLNVLFTNDVPHEQVVVMLNRMMAAVAGRPRSDERVSGADA